MLHLSKYVRGHSSDANAVPGHWWLCVTVEECTERQHQTSYGSHLGDSHCTKPLASLAHLWSAAGTVPTPLEIDMTQNNQNQQNQRDQQNQQQQDQRNERNEQNQQQQDQRNEQNQQEERNERNQR